MNARETPFLSIVIPAHNSEGLLPDTWDALRRRFEVSEAEVIVVENGSTDNTWQCIQRIADGIAVSDLRVLPLRSAKGMGNALREGVLASSGRFVLLTADDLPFGFSDWEAFQNLDHYPTVTIGSKGHPSSVLRRDAKRRIASFGFRLLRRLVLNSHVTDSQGTLIVDGQFARTFAAVSQEEGFLWTTEMVFAAEWTGRSIIEVPVELVSRHDAHGSRIMLADVKDMYEGLWRIRRDRRRLATLLAHG
jgi:glycosyltransferase involved in cell wall biosynthesis